MNTNEWGPIAALIDNCCKDEFDEIREAAYFEVLCHLPAVDVRRAVVNLLGRPGGDWSPASAKIAGEVHAVQYIGTFGWAYERFQAVVQTLPDEMELRLISPGASGLQPLEVAEIAEDLLAIHDVFGKILYDALVAAATVEAGYRYVQTLTRRESWGPRSALGRAYRDACFAYSAAGAQHQVQAGERTIA